MMSIGMENIMERLQAATVRIFDLSPEKKLIYLVLLLLSDPVESTAPSINKSTNYFPLFVTSVVQCYKTISSQILLATIFRLPVIQS